MNDVILKIREDLRLHSSEKARISGERCFREKVKLYGMKASDVFRFVVNHKDKMPRTALRYAIEKMPDEMRQTAMARG